MVFMRTSKKLLSLFLSAVLCLSLLPAMAWAEDETYVAQIGNDKYTTFEAAYAVAVTNGASTKTEIKLLKSTTSVGLGTDGQSVNLELDLNGQTLTFTNPAVGSTGTETQAFRFLAGSTVSIKNGTIKVDKNNASAENPIKMLINNYTDLTLDGVTLDGTNIAAAVYGASPTPGDAYTLSNNSGTINIKNSTIIARRDDEGVEVAFDSCKFGSYNAPTVTVENSTIDGKIEETGGTIIIKSGSFTDLANAVKYADDNAQIKLLEDTSGAGVFAPSSNKNITIDLNSKTYTCVGPAVGSSGTESQAFHLENGTTTIKNGTITSTANSGVKMLVQNYSNLTLENITLDGSKLDKNNIGFYTLSNNKSGITTTIGEGTQIIAHAAEADGEGLKGSAFAFDADKGSKVIVKSGAVIKGLMELSGDSTITVKGGSFTDLANAVKYAENGATIKLADDVTVESTITLDKKLTIDLNGHTVTGNDGTNGVRVFQVTGGDVNITGSGTLTVASGIGESSSVIRVGDNNGGDRTVKLTIGNGVEVKSEYSYGVTVFGNKTTETLDINGKITTKVAPAVSGNGSDGYGDTSITVGQAAILETAEDYAVYHPQSGTLTINGTVKGKGGIEAKAGNTTVAVGNSAKITATATETSHEKNDNGTSTSGYAIAVVENSAYAGGAKVGVNGGTVTGAMIVVADNEVDTDKKGSISITGGTFSSDPSAYVEGNGTNYIVRKDTSSYTVLAKLNLTSGTYLSDPTGALANRCYISSNANGVWVVSYDAPSDGGSSTTKTETTTNADGSKTTTTTDTKTGAVTETTTKTETAANGTKTETKVEVVTQKDGTVTEKQTETATAKNGTTATKVETTDAAGKTETKVEAKVTAAAVTEAKTADKPVTIPVTVESTKSAETAATVSVSVPKSAGSTKVEVPVTNVTAGTVAVLVKADGTEEIIKTSVLTEDGVALKVEGDVQIKIIDNTKEFTDVVDNHWAGDAIDFATSHEIFNGTGDKSFAPEATMTRAMLFTVLARFDDAPVVTTGENWYADSMEWAKTNGVSDGTNPEASISREQLATMLYRYAGAPAVTADLSAYGDAATVSDYAAAAMQWAVSVGLINGIDGNLAPQGFATRAQLAAIMQRFCTNVVF